MNTLLVFLIIAVAEIAGVMVNLASIALIAFQSRTA